MRRVGKGGEDMILRDDVGTVRFVNSDFVTRIFGVSKNTLGNWNRCGKLNPVRLLGRTKLYYRVEEIIEVLKRNGLTEDEARAIVNGRLEVGDEFIVDGSGVVGDGHDG